MSSDVLAREFRDLPLTLLDPPLLDARIDRDPDQLAELQRDIAHRGLLYPLIVARTGDRYEIIDGYTRFICAQRLALAVVPCSIYPTKDDAQQGAKYAANVYRLDMSPAEEAVMFRELLTHECGHDVERLCAMVNKKLTYVDARLALLAGGEDVFEAVKAKTIGLGVAEELNKIAEAHWRAYYLDAAVRSGATRGVVVGWVQEWKQIFGGAKPPAQPDQAAEPSMAEETEHPFTCVICGKHDNVHLIRQINIHQHCKLAILDPLLANARGEG